MALQPTVLLVSVDHQNVHLALGSIVLNLLTLVIKYHAVIHKVLSKIQLRVGAAVQIVLRNLIVIKLLVLVELYHIVTKKMVLQPTVLPASVDLQDVHLNLVYSVTNQTMVLDVVIKLLI